MESRVGRIHHVGEAVRVTYTHTHAHTQTHQQTHTHTCAHTPAHTHTHTHICIYICVCPYTYHIPGQVTRAKEAADQAAAEQNLKKKICGILDPITSVCTCLIVPLCDVHT